MPFNEGFKSLPDRDDMENEMKIHVKGMLLHRLFIGTFQEKRYVDSLKAYRDVIVISDQETELIQTLKAVRKHIQNFYNTGHWIGITTPKDTGSPAGYCLWVQLPEEVFGSYWYKISKIKFYDKETMICLKILRPVNAASSNGVLSKTSKRFSSSKEGFNVSHSNDISSINIKESFTAAWLQIINSLTRQNTVNTIKFLFLLFVAAIAGLFKAVEFLGDFTVRLIKEISNCLRIMTPIIIACIKLIEKIIGGLYLLILSMWRDSLGAKYVYVTRPPAGSNEFGRYKSILPKPTFNTAKNGRVT